MKALSIKQPWAWLICKNLKPVENRGWHTNFTGRIYIHAGKTFDRSEFVFASSALKRSPTYNAEARSFIEQSLYCKANLSYGAIIGEVDVTGCKFRFGEENDNLYSTWHIPGQYGLMLANGVLYDKPIPYRGQLGLFEVTLPEAK